MVQTTYEGTGVDHVIATDRLIHAMCQIERMTNTGTPRSVVDIGILRTRWPIRSLGTGLVRLLNADKGIREFIEGSVEQLTHNICAGETATKNVLQQADFIHLYYLLHHIAHQLRRPFLEAIYNMNGQRGMIVVTDYSMADVAKGTARNALTSQFENMEMDERGPEKVIEECSQFTRDDLEELIGNLWPYTQTCDLWTGRTMVFGSHKKFPSIVLHGKEQRSAMHQNAVLMRHPELVECF